MRRKMKTATYRSRPEDTSDTFPIDENKIKNELVRNRISTHKALKEKSHLLGQKSTSTAAIRTAPNLVCVSIHTPQEIKVNSQKVVSINSGMTQQNNSKFILL